MSSENYIIVNERKSVKLIEAYLNDNADIFVPTLSSRVNIHSFSLKIFENAEQFWVLVNDKAIGFMACYFNHPEKEYGFISTISIKSKYQGIGIGKELINDAIHYARENQFKQIRLEVNRINTRARVFYERLGFVMLDSSPQSYFLLLNI